MNKKIQGKKNRASGQRFELRVKKDLESKGWIVSKWQNNIELHKENSKEVFGFYDGEKWIYGKLVPAKMGRFRSNQGGFPDFIAFKEIKIEEKLGVSDFGDIQIGERYYYEVIGVEVKSNGYLDKIEKEKCKWLLDNHIFSKILVAKKGKKRGEIIYNEFK